MKRIALQICCLLVILASSTALGATLSWQTEPVLGHSLTYNGDNVIGVDGGLFITIPHYSIFGDPLFNVGSTVNTFYIDPTTWDGTRWYDPVKEIYSGSGVNLTQGATYAYVAQFTFIGNLLNPTYTLTPASNSSFTAPADFIMLTTGIGNLGLPDVGAWRYTETWTDLATFNTESFTRNFVVQVVPVPPTLLLLGPALLCLIGLRRRNTPQR